ncbi:YggS family pyridoxal phosphate-dependent enzyme [Patescibacteria group bacterium]|nr:YggS family pyridoxal phosphate-dependent enzyme [Patescibacteria group bacterium]
MRIQKNLANFNSELAEVCASCGQNPAEIRLIAITKNRSADEVNELLAAGVSRIGENRLQEALIKLTPRISGETNLLPCEKHFIGSIQSNKAREIAQNFDVVQSVGSVKVAKILDSAVNSPLPIFLQANLAHEFQKSGFIEDDLAEAVAEIRKLPNIKIEGLMVMGVLGDLEKTREIFTQAKKLNDQFGFKNLSAGMSGDWQIAVEEGANFLRIGNKLFEN